MNAGRERSSSGVPPQLTPAANELLDEYSLQYRRRILDEITRLSSDDSTSQARLADIEEAVHTLGFNPPSKSLSSLRHTFLIPMVAVAGAAFVVSVVSIATSHFRDAAAIGVLLTGAATLFALAYEVRSSMSERAAFSALFQRGLATPREFVIGVAELELLARDSAREMLGLSSNTASLGAVLDALSQMGWWDVEDIEEFRQVMTLRNSIVHERVRSISRSDLSVGLRTVEKLARRLRDAAGSTPGTTKHRFTAEGARFESSVGDMLRYAAIGDLSAAPDGNFDYLLETPSASVGVIVKYRRTGSVRSSDIDSWLSAVRQTRLAGVLVITNAPLSSSVIDLDPRILARPRIEVVQWNGSSDSGAVVSAFMRIIDSQKQADTDRVRGLPRRVEARFVIFRDGKGRFRYRLVAVNGEILLSSPPYEVRDEVYDAIDRVRSTAPAAAVDGQSV